MRQQPGGPLTTGEAGVTAAVKFCGSCNPELDLGRLWRELQEAAAATGIEVVTATSVSSPVDAIVMLCGCRRACLDRPDVRAQGRRQIVVAGETLDLRPLAAAELARAIVQTLVDTGETRLS